MKTVVFLITTLMVVGCSTPNIIKQEERAISVPTYRDTVYVVQFPEVEPDSINWQDILDAEKELTRIRYQVLLSAVQSKNDNLLQSIRRCQELFNRLKNRTTVQTQPPDVKYTPPPVECPPEEKHGVFYFIGFGVIVSGLTVLVLKLTPIVSKFL